MDCLGEAGDENCIVGACHCYVSVQHGGWCMEQRVSDLCTASSALCNSECR